MTYCLGIITRTGLVMACDSRTNAGLDQVNVCQKMHTFVKEGNRAFIVLASGGLSLSQSVLALLRTDFQHGAGLATVNSMYDAARCVGEQVRKIAQLDGPALEHDQVPFNVMLLLGGQIKGRDPELYLIYPQGNPLQATPDCPFLQLGENKYGRPILDRAVRYETTTLEHAAKLALISIDSTMRSNLTVGPPIDLAVYARDELRITQQLRLGADNPQLVAIRTQWEAELRQAVERMPELRF